MPLNLNLLDDSPGTQSIVENWKPAEKRIKRISKPLPLHPSVRLNPTPLAPLLPLVHRAKNIVPLDATLIAMIAQIAYSAPPGAARRTDGLVGAVVCQSGRASAGFRRCRCSPPRSGACNLAVSLSRSNQRAGNPSEGKHCQLSLCPPTTFVPSTF